MNVINPLRTPVSQPSSQESAAEGGAQQQRWLQDLERSWLRSWQQAEPVPSRAENQAVKAGKISENGDLEAHGSVTSPSQDGLPVAVRPYAVDVDAERTASAAPPLEGMRTQGAPVLWTQAAEAREASVAPSSSPTPMAMATATAKLAGVVHPETRACARAELPEPRLPAAQHLQPVSLHLREGAFNSVTAALRDSQLGAMASQAAAEALARQLEKAGYARVQVYVNGATPSRQAIDPMFPQQEKHHGH